MDNKKSRKLKVLFWCAVLSALSWMPCSLRAFDATADQVSGLQEIVVTAERREESIERVPASITALSQQTMDDLHIQNVADLATIVPGLALSSPSNYQDSSNIVIRGISSSANAPTIQLYIDETPIAIRQYADDFSKSPYPNIFDLDRVEVLRGPQGALFGASAMGGAIRFVTPQPNLRESSGFVKSEFGYTDGGSPSYEAGAAYGSPIVVGTAGFRVSAWYQSVGGFIDQEDPYTGQVLDKNANKSNAYVIRPAFTWAPTDELTITPAFYLQHQYSQNSNSYWRNGLPNPEGSNHVWGGVAQPMTDDLRVGSLSVKYNFTGLALVSDTSYLDRTSSTIEDATQLLDYALAGTPFIPSLNSLFIEAQNNSFTRSWQQEFRISSQDPASRVNWVAGAFYRRAAQRLQQLVSPDLTPLTEYAFGATSEDIFGVPNYNYNGQVLNGYNDLRSVDISEAVFGDIAVNVTGHLKLDVGVRAERLVVGQQNRFLAGPLNGVVTSFTTLPDAVAHPVSPRASLTYQFTDADMIYVSAAKGERPGGGNNPDLNTDPQCQKSLTQAGYSSVPAAYTPDHLWSYEIGTKDRGFDGRLSIQGSIYYIRWNDQQKLVALPGCLSAFTVNQGASISQGFDLQLAALITQDLKVGAQAGYGETFNPDTIYGSPDPVTGVAPLLTRAGYKYKTRSGAINAEYSRDISTFWSDAHSYVRLDFRWLGGLTPADPLVAGYDAETDPYPDRAYSVLNLRFGVTHGGLDVSAYVNNVTGSDPRLGYTRATLGEPLFFAAAIRPRTAGITAWYRF